VNPTAFHALHDADGFDVATNEDVSAKRVVTPRSLLGTGDVISESERQESDSLDPVNPTETGNIFGQRESGLSMGS
jgi:hypothetical protein